MRVRRDGRRLVYVLPLLVAVALTACGTKGYAPPLGTSIHATLNDIQTHKTLGTATMTPMYALHATVYYQGQVIPTTGARTPAQLRKGSCFGTVVAPLTDGISAPPAAQNETQFAPSGGMYVAAPADASLYVTVLQRPNDPTAPIVACGHPLSERRQYFNLFPPSDGSGGIAIGTALMEPLIVTRVRFDMKDSSLTIASWSLRNGGCTGSLIGSTTEERGEVVFSQVHSSEWLIARLTNNVIACGKVNE